MALELDPQQTEEYHDKVRDVLATMMVGEAQSAIEQLEGLIREFPEGPEVFFLMGINAYRLKDEGLAIQWINRAHELDSQCREYADALAVIYTRLGKLADGLYFAKLATVLEPHADIQPLLPMDLSNFFESLSQVSPSRHFVDASVYFNAREFEKAKASCEKELRINKEHGPCYALLGKTNCAMGDYESARLALDAAAYLEPANATFHVERGKALYHLGEWEAAIEAHRRALKADKESVDVAAEISGYAAYLGAAHADVRDEFAVELRARAETIENADEFLERTPHHPGEPIGVGIVSNSVFDSDGARLLEPILRWLDRDKFKVFLYQQSITEDTVNDRIKVFADSSRRVFDIEDEVLSIIMNGDGVDILVDLCGYTPSARAGLVAMRPAHAQLCLSAPPYGLAMPGIDFVLSDPVTKADDEAALGAGQEALDLPYGHFAILPFEVMPDVIEPPARENGYVTFGGRCDLALMTAECVEMWSAVLNAVPDSQLLLGYTPQIPRTVRVKVQDLFEAAGITDRIEFWESSMPGRPDPKYFNHIDIMLDTTPVSGRIDICEAMWMGVPVLTLYGRGRAAKSGASILTAAGHADWIGDTADAVAGRAQELAGDLDALAETRSGLRDQVSGTAVFQPQVFVRTLENALEQALTKAHTASD